MISAKAKRTAEKYQGAIASGYEGKRVGQDKWKAEDAIVRKWLARLPNESEILDVPFGTGRFIPIYAESSFRVTGIDINDDMLRIARPKLKGVKNVAAHKGSIFDLAFPDKSFDVVLCIRILNLIDASDMQLALKELMRVARHEIIFNLRVWHKHTLYRHPQKMDDVLEAMGDEWKIVEDVAIHEPDFRMICLALA